MPGPAELLIIVAVAMAVWWVGQWMARKGYNDPDRWPAMRSDKDLPKIWIVGLIGMIALTAYMILTQR